MKSMQGNRHPNRTLAAAWRASSTFCTKHKGPGLVLVGALIGVVAGIAAAISTNLYMTNLLHKGQKVAPFCCPGLARELHWYRNASVNPCRDFFSYICSNVIRDKWRDEEDLTTQLQQSFMTGAMLQGDAGRFLTSFYRSCVKTLPHPKSAFYSLAKALLHLWEPHEPVDTRKAILYIFDASIKYRMSSAVYVSIEVNKSVVVIKSLAMCYTQAFYYDIMTAVVEALNERADFPTVSSAAAFGLRSQLCEDIMSYPLRRRQYTVVNEENNIQEEVWNVADLDAGLDAYGSSLLKARFVNVMGARRIRLIHDQFAVEEKNSAAGALKVAFLVWHSVARELQAVYIVHNSENELFRQCRIEALRMSAVWYTFNAEMLTSQDKDTAAQRVFTAVKRSVYKDIQASLLMDADDTERLHNFFKNMVLVTPMQASHTSTVPVPNGSEHFGENRLRGYLYEFSVNRELETTMTDVSRVRYEDVLFMGERHLFLSPGIYGYIDGSSSEYGLPNNARLGRLLAEVLWYMTFAKVKWTPKGLANIKRFRQCFIMNNLGNDKTEGDSPLHRVLGLLSVVNVVSKSDWHTLKPAWSLWHISNAQFFFMLSTYYKCRQPRPLNAREMNVSLLYSEDFTIAFECPFSAPMAKTLECFAKALRELQQDKTKSP